MGGGGGGGGALLLHTGTIPYRKQREGKNLLIRQHHALTPSPSPEGRGEKSAQGNNFG
ncbi:hypothetical protein CCP3SC1_680010 [Gammaproteobacteria bacterium]